MDPQVPTSMLIVMGTASMLSLASLFYLFQKHIDGRPLLPYEPRQRVPWGALVALVAIAMPLAGVLVFLTAGDAPVVEVEPAAAETPIENQLIETQLVEGWGTFTFMIVFVLGVGAWIAAFFRADSHDFGLPTSGKQAAQDIGIGCLATFAALLPIYIVQLTLVNALDTDTKHPLVEQLQENHSPAMLLLGFAMAVIAAPLFEEFTFRCLLQGWLEKCEDETVGFEVTRREPPSQAANLTDASQANEPAEQEFIFVHQTLAEAIDGRHQESEPVDIESTRIEPAARGWIPGLPHGWTPILISGIIFGLAHLGHGVAPVSLILFGIVLAYLYQRTHRLLPSITAHMVFNGYSMLLLWLQLNLPA